MQLLEREDLLCRLDELLQLVAAGEGRGALVFGEAGIGKTALVERFAASAEGARVLRGGCEDLFTARPLGPLHDIARAAGGRLRSLFAEGAEREALFGAFLGELQAPGGPVVLIVEDVHWADEATLDLLKYLGRRITSTSALLLVTYREDELAPSHPLRSVLGDFQSSVVSRLRVPPLSRRAVATLAAEAGQPSDGLYEVTEGNPFFVTEVLSVGGTRVPDTVRDAVLARLAKLSAPARETADLVSVSPTPVELWILRADPGVIEGAEECVTRGVLVARGDRVLFRHELARRVSEGSLSGLRRADLHARILARLLSREDEVELARLAYHAEQAGDSATVLRLAPRAAAHAAALKAHREAAAHYRSALAVAGDLPPEECARLHERCSYECYLTEQIPEALERREQALEIWESLGAREDQGRNLRWLSRLAWYSGDNRRAMELAERCLAMLEPLPPGHEVAMAYSNRSQLHMLQSETDEAVSWGTKAIELARRLDDLDTLAHALNNVGSAEALAGRAGGVERLEQSLAISLEQGFHEHAARAYTNLSTSAVVHRDYRRAMRDLDEGIDYCSERDLDSWRLYMLAWRARTLFELGRWGRATADAESVVDHPQVSAITRIPALAVLGHLRVRSGEGEPAEPLAEARALAARTGEVQRIAPVAAALAEAAWLAGERQACRAEAEWGYQLALGRDEPEALGKLGYWMWKAGAIDRPPDGAFEPYALQMRGDWRRAAAVWKELGCPYESALALAESGREESLREALDLLIGLGAKPLERRVRLQLRELGARQVARGPRPATRANPARLTNRQLEVLGLLGEGLRNAQIARRLCIAPKTVGHHVSEILAKLEVGSRGQAVARARALGILDPA